MWESKIISTRAFQPVRYIPASQTDHLRAATVQRFYAVAHGRLDPQGNHWCFYLQISGTQSIHVDITPSYSEPGTVLQDSSKTFLVVSLIDYLYSNGATKVCALGVAENLKVGDVLNRLIEKGRHRYEFDSSGRGCRMWVDEQITLFLEKRYILDANEASMAKAAILTQYPGKMQYPLVPGAYY